MAWLRFSLLYFIFGVFISTFCLNRKQIFDKVVLSMDIKTNSELQKIIADRVRAETLEAVATSLNAAPVYVAQIIAGARPVSKKIAGLMGYEMVRQPKPDRLFAAVAE